MTRQKQAVKRSIEIVKAIIISQQKLFDAVFGKGTPEVQDILHQMIHGKPHYKSIKLYQYLLKCFLLSGGGDQSNLAYYVKQKYKPTFIRVKQVLQAAQCPKL